MATDFLSLAGCGPKDDAERAKMAEHPYREALGCLLYISRRTRPDICFAVSLLCRVAHDPAIHHWTAVKRLLRYLRGTAEYGLYIGPSQRGPAQRVAPSQHDDILEAFVDADWAGEKVSRKSTTGFIVKLYGSCVAWRSVKQSIVALSTAEAEYVAMSDCVRALARARNLLMQIGITVPVAQVWEDNQPAITWADHGGGMRSKHIDVRYHYVRDEVLNNRIRITYCPTHKMQADALTKPVCADKHNKFVEDLILASHTSSSRRSVGKVVTDNTTRADA